MDIDNGCRKKEFMKDRKERRKGDRGKKGRMAKKGRRENERDMSEGRRKRSGYWLKTSKRMGGTERDGEYLTLGREGGLEEANIK